MHAGQKGCSKEHRQGAIPNSIMTNSEEKLSSNMLTLVIKQTDSVYASLCVRLHKDQ